MTYEYDDAIKVYFAQPQCLICGSYGPIGFGDIKEEASEDARWMWNRRAERTCYPVLEDETLACSECDEDIDGYGWNYCPNCGAKVVSDGRL